MIKIFNIPKLGDKLELQYYGDTVEIRSNMTGLSGSGDLIAIVENVDDQVKCSRIKALEDLYGLLTIAIK